MGDINAETATLDALVAVRNRDDAVMLSTGQFGPVILGSGDVCSVDESLAKKLIQEASRFHLSRPEKSDRAADHPGREPRPGLRAR